LDYFLQGLKPEVRKEAWKYLLGFYPFEMTDIERMELRERKESEYWTIKNQWQSFTPDQENRFAKWRELKHLISKLLIINGIVHLQVMVCLKLKS
ncbi:MAG: hypothetical protein MJE68_24060, partial [Proteobacteria bacterium]|nr:hypothetical protein [Pseudomonadota bacterium]